jgi:hypothetical protein
VVAFRSRPATQTEKLMRIDMLNAFRHYPRLSILAF